MWGQGLTLPLLSPVKKEMLNRPIQHVPDIQQSEELSKPSVAGSLASHSWH
jgi:hypothetical protein